MTSLKPRDMRELLIRAAAALETPNDLSEEDKQWLIEDLLFEANQMHGAERQESAKR